MLQGNTFGRPVYTLADSNPGGLLPDSWREVTIGGYGDTASNWLVDSNSFVNGLKLGTADTGGSYSNVRISNNKGGTANVCPALSGVTYSNNSNCG